MPIFILGKYLHRNVKEGLIMDDIKTIDDAINEATLEMRTEKEDYKG